MFTKRAIQIYLAAIALFAIAGVVFFTYTRESPPPSSTQTPVPAEDLSAYATTTILGTLPESLAVLYITTATSSDIEGRNWPTKIVWRREGNAVPEVMAAVGKEGEYPSTFALSPDHNYLAVNLEKAVDLVDLKTKMKTRVFTTDKWVIAAGFSSDSSKLLITDGAVYAGEESLKPLYIIDIKTGTKSVVVPDVRLLGLGDIAPVLLRSDGVLLFNEIGYKDCGIPGLYMLDAAHKTATTTYEKYGLSDDGTLAIGSAIETAPVPPEQEGMCSPGAYPTVASVVEPVSGSVAGRVGKSGEPFTLVAFSPDHTQVLFKTSKDLKEYTYYVQTINNSSAPKVVSDPWTLLASWKASAGPITYAQGEQNYNALYLGNTPIVISPQWPELIGQYFK